MDTQRENTVAEELVSSENNATYIPDTMIHYDDGWSIPLTFSQQTL